MKVEGLNPRELLTLLKTNNGSYTYMKKKIAKRKEHKASNGKRITYSAKVKRRQQRAKMAQLPSTANSKSA